jgi:DNA-binding IclR family transcriptional regulator
LVSDDKSLLPNDDASVRAVKRAVAILRAFGPADRSLPLGEIARRATLDKATARRLLRTLIGESLVEQETLTREYSLGLGVLELAAGATPADELRRRAQLLLATLVEATRTGAAYLIVPHHGAGLCVESVVGERPLPATWSIGERRALNSCAATRVLMAHLPLEGRMAALSGVLPALTAATPTDPFLLSSLLETIRLRDWEIGLDDVVPGVASLGLPVRGETGDVIAALGITGPREEILEGERPRYLEVMRVKVRELERRLSMAPPTLAGVRGRH